MLRHLSQNPSGAAPVESTGAHSPHGAFPRQAVAEIVGPAPQAHQNGKLSAAELHADIEPLRSVRVVQPVGLELAQRHFVHLGRRETLDQFQQRGYAQSHAVAPGIELTQIVMAHQVFAAGVGLGVAQGG